MVAYTFIGSHARFKCLKNKITRNVISVMLSINCLIQAVILEKQIYEKLLTKMTEINISTELLVFKIH